MLGIENYPQDSRGPQDAPCVTNSSEPTISDLMAPVFRPTPQDRIAPQNSANEARLLTVVYTQLGFFDPERAERAPEVLEPHITELWAAHPGKRLQPLVAVLLNREFGLVALHKNFQRSHRMLTDIKENLWHIYKDAPSILNRRSLDGENDPKDLTVVGMPLEADNDVDEPGLTLTYKTLEEQRKAIGRGMLVNVVDWIALASLRRERGEGTIDRKTCTRFPQIPVQPLRGSDHAYHASYAPNDLGWADLRVSVAGVRNNSGVRRLVGYEPSYMPYIKL